jgi:PAS domain S-box-containing protein
LQSCFFRALGYSVRNEVEGRSILEYANESDKETLGKSFDIWRKTGKVHNYEVRMNRADGSAFPALMNATSIHDEFGRVIACNAVILNITEVINARKKVEVAVNDLVQKERELHEMNEELKRVERQKKNLFRW